jgi:hypothetical protein
MFLPKRKRPPSPFTVANFRCKREIARDALLHAQMKSRMVIAPPAIS